MPKFEIATAVNPGFVAILALGFLLSTHSFAQTAPASQSPTSPQSGQPSRAPAAQQPTTGQEPAAEEEIGHRKKPKAYKNWTFNVGGGANLDTGTTKNFVRGGGFVASAGVARNANKYLGLRAEFLYADLPLKDSALASALATGATNNLYSATLDPIINIPVTKEWGGYFIFGGAYYHRAGSLDNDTTVPGSPCTAFWRWWGNCNAASVPLSGNFTDTSLNQWGYNFGAGITRKTPSGVEIYAEYRIMHGSANGNTTDFRPVTIGLRW